MAERRTKGQFLMGALGTAEALTIPKSSYCLWKSLKVSGHVFTIPEHHPRKFHGEIPIFVGLVTGQRQKKQSFSVLQFGHLQIWQKAPVWVSILSPRMQKRQFSVLEHVRCRAPVRTGAPKNCKKKIKSGFCLFFRTFEKLFYYWEMCKFFCTHT